MKRKLLTIGLTGLVLIGLVGCSKKTEDEIVNEEPKTEVEAGPVIEEPADEDVEDEIVAADWQEADTLESANENAGIATEFGELEGYKVVGYYYVEGGVAAVYSDEDSHFIEVRKADINHVASAMMDLGTDKEYTSGDITVNDTLVSTFSDEEGVKLLIWTDATGEGSDVQVENEFSVWSVDKAIDETDLVSFVGLVK